MHMQQRSVGVSGPRVILPPIISKDAASDTDPATGAGAVPPLPSRGFWSVFWFDEPASGAGAVPPLPSDNDDESYNSIGDHKNEEFVNVGVLMVDLGVIVQIVAEVMTLVLNV